jgi:ABC-type nitrate/sulfonate/bicarbonate transport system substrate-binding protein
MKHLLHFALLLAASLSAQAAEISVDSTSPAATVVRHFGWLDAELAQRGVQVRWAEEGKLDFTGASGIAALKARAAGGAVKAVYVLWRDASNNDQFLLASETFLNTRPQEAQSVVAAFERARNWIAANPEEAAKVLPEGATRRNLTGSRPGPAQLAALGGKARELGLDARLPGQLLDDSLVRAVMVGSTR